MNTDLNLSELFERYLENDLTLRERKEFEQRLLTDRAFAERFRLHKEVDRALIDDDILQFRMQLEQIGLNNKDIMKNAPMVLSEELNPEIDQAILEQDVIALREQLNRIHASVVKEEVDPMEILGYSGIERAIANQDTFGLHSELEQFGQQNRSQPAEPEESELSRQVDTAIMQEDVMALRTTLEEIGDRAIATPKVIPIRRKVMAYATTAVAAVFILLVAGSLLLNSGSGSVGSDRTFAKYFKAYDGIGVRRGPAEEGNTVIELGIQKYNHGEFRNALELFDASISDGNRNDAILVFAGTSAMFTGDYDKALRYFGSCEANSLFSEEINWYSAGCYLRKGVNDKAITLLNRISSDPGNKYLDEASALLKRLAK